MSIDVLQAKIRKLKNPTMVSLCPEWELIPEAVRAEAAEQFGNTLRGAAETYRLFCCRMLDALQGIVPAVSVESGCFLALGPDGVSAMQDVLQYAAKKEYYVLLDLMRADLGASAEGMAKACLGGIPLGEQRIVPYPCDGVLLDGYLGSDSVKPYTQYCADGKNVFVIARSSNKSAREVQDLLCGSRMMYQVMADLAMRWSEDVFGRNGYAEVGLAVGAAKPQVLQNLRSKYDRLFFIVPGYGTQGGLAKDVQYAFDKFGHGAVVMAGRSILCAYQKKDQETEYLEAAKEAAVHMREQILNYITVI